MNVRAYFKLAQPLSRAIEQDAHKNSQCVLHNFVITPVIAQKSKSLR